MNNHTLSRNGKTTAARVILVTGANGYLGRGIVKQLLDDGQIVIAADYSLDGVDSRAIKKECDLFTIKEPFPFFDKPDVLLHLAWRNGFVHNSDTHLNDLPGHVSFIKRMIEGGIKKICIMGTMHEVGFYEGSIDERTSCNPLNLYGIAKNALRDASKLLCQESNVLFQWLRGFYIVENTSYGNSIFSKIVAAEKKGDRLFPFTTGLNQADFLDYSIFCLQTATAVEQDEILGIINICSGRPQKLADAVEGFILKNNLKIKLDYEKYPDRPYDSKAVWGNSNKIDLIMKKRKW